MQAPRKPASRTRALLGLALLMAVLLFLLALIEGPDAKLGCTPIAPASARSAEPESLESPPSELDDPGTTTKSDAPTAVVQSPATRLRGIVLDDVTGEPVPWVRIHVSTAAGSTDVGTQSDGSFATQLVVESGNLDADVSDDGQPVGTAHAQWPLPDAARGWIIRVPIGPTFPIATIDGGTPSSSARWRFRLLESRLPLGTAGTILVSADKLEPQSKGDLRDWGWRSLRDDGDRLFVRWPKRAFQANAEWLPSLSVRSDPTSSKSNVAVYSTVGIHSPLSIVTTPFAVLIGSVGVPSGVSPAGTHVVACDPFDADQKTFDTVPFFAEIETKEDGGYAFELPMALTYSITAWHRSLVMAEAGAVVHRGRTYGPDLQLLAPTESVTRVDATLYFERRAERFGTLLRIVPASVSRCTDALLLDMSRREAELTTMAVGTYRVEDIGIDGPPRFNGIRRRQPMPARELDPLPADTALPRMHRIEVRNAGSIETCTLSAGPAGSMFTTSKQGNTFAWMVPPDNPPVFTVWCHGCSPQTITEDRFEKNEQELVATTTLSPGWGALLAFRAGDPEDKKSTRNSRNPPGNMSAADALGFVVPPLPGVQVDYRGVKLGTSDGDGCLLVTAKSRPERLTLVAPGWHMTSMSRMPGAGSRWWVWMQRDP